LIKKTLLSLTLLLGLALPAQAAVTRGVGPSYNTAGSGFDTSVATTLNGCTIGNMLAIIVQWTDVGAASAITTITVGGESNATLIVASKVSSTTTHAQIAYLNNLTSSANKTITVNFDNAVYASIGVMEYAGQDTSTQPDATNTGTGSFTDPSLSLTTVANNALIVATVGDNSANGTAGSGYTLWGTRPNVGYFEEDLDNVDGGAAGARTVDFVTGAGGATWYLSAVSFKPAGGGVNLPVRHSVRNQ